MKNILKITLTFIFVLSFLFNAFASGWVVIPSTNDWIFLNENNLPVKDNWITYDSDNDGKKEYFYLGSNGIMYKNKTSPDGKYLDNNGCYSINGIVQKEQAQNVYVPETTKAAEISPANQISQSQSNVINASDASSSFEKKRELKNNIGKKSGVEFVDTKKVNGKSWVNLIKFSGNDSYLKAPTNNFNELSFEAGVVEISDNGQYLLTIYVNNEVLGEFDEEYFNTGEKISINFDPNSEIMMVYTCIAEDGMYLATDNKNLYLRNAYFSRTDG